MFFFSMFDLFYVVLKAEKTQKYIYQNQLELYSNLISDIEKVSTRYRIKLGIL